MQKTIEKILKIVIGSTFFVPLLVLPNSYIFPFIVPKIIYFRSLVLVMLGLYLILLFSNFQKYRPKFSWVNIAVLGFYLSFAISTFVGTDAYHSFWDYTLYCLLFYCYFCRAYLGRLEMVASYFFVGGIYCDVYWSFTTLC